MSRQGGAGILEKLELRAGMVREIYPKTINLEGILRIQIH